jgi:hypothetical protein
MVMGDWDCSHCGLSYQWARVQFRVGPEGPGGGPILATIGLVETFIPLSAGDFDGVNYLDADLVLLTAEKSPRDVPAFLSTFEQLSPEEKTRRIVVAYKQWAAEVPGVSLNSER